MFEGIHANKTKDLDRCIICTYCYFVKANFRMQPEVCDSCYDLMSLLSHVRNE